MFNLVRLKPRPEPAALAFSSSEPGQSRCWAVTNGLAWPSPNRLGLARLTALGRAGHITTSHISIKGNYDKSYAHIVLSVRIHIKDLFKTMTWTFGTQQMKILLLLFFARDFANHVFLIYFWVQLPLNSHISVNSQWID